MRSALVLALLAVPLLAGCAETPSPPDVMATFYPLGFLAERMVNGTLRVELMVPAGIEPHDWEPTPTDVTRAAGAKMFLAQGAGFEPWLDGILASLGEQRPPLAYMTSNLALREGADEDGATRPDPHTWLDPALFAEQATLAEDALAAAFPASASEIATSAAALRAELAALDADFASGLSSCETRTIIANHDAYGYLAARHGFDVVAISGLSPEAEPSPEDLARAIDAAREHNATIIFFEELVTPAVAEVVAREVGAQTRVLSPVEGLTSEQRAAGEDYLTLMRANLASLREAMRCT